MKRRHEEAITSDDYFERAAEFKVWLTESRGKYFDELSSERAREYFDKFVRRWNSGKLDEKYYKGISSTTAPSSATTRYKWWFKNVDEHQLESIRDNVDTNTNVKAEGKDFRTSHRETGSDQRPMRGVSGPSLGPTRGTMPEEDMDEEDRERYRRALEKRRRNEERKTHEAVLDELAPRETGRESVLAKRRAANAFHKREKSPDIELSEDVLMGSGGDDSFAAAKRREAARQERQQKFRQEKASVINERLAAYRAKEQSTMDMLRKMAAERK